MRMNRDKFNARQQNKQDKLLIEAQEGKSNRPELFRTIQNALKKDQSMNASKVYKLNRRTTIIGRQNVLCELWCMM